MFMHFAHTLSIIAGLVTAATAGHVQFMPFSSTEYNRLPHFLDLPPEGPEDLLSVQPGSEVLRKHAMGAQVGIYLNHRHFELWPGEKLVAQRRGDAVFMEPLLNNTEALPYFYRISEDSLGGFEFQPMEFVDQPNDDYKVKHQAVVSNTAFLLDYASTLRDNSLLSKFGLFVLHRDEIVGNRTLETAAGSRALVVNAAGAGDAAAAAEKPEDDMEVRTVIFTAPEVPHKIGFCGHSSCGHSNCGHNSK
jgi:hypothetical protein